MQQSESSDFSEKQEERGEQRETEGEGEAVKRMKLSHSPIYYHHLKKEEEGQELSEREGAGEKEEDSGEGGYKHEESWGLEEWSRQQVAKRPSTPSDGQESEEDSESSPVVFSSREPQPQ